MLGHIYKAVTLTGSLTLTTVASGLAVVVAFALVDAVTMYITFLGGLYSGNRGSSKHGSGGSGQRDGGKFSSCSHRITPKQLIGTLVISVEPIFLVPFFGQKNIRRRIIFINK
jgi:hypothetical protein